MTPSTTRTVDLVWVPMVDLLSPPITIKASMDNSGFAIDLPGTSTDLKFNW